MIPSPTRRESILTDRVSAFLLAAITAAVLLLFRATIQTGDSLAYVLAARTGERLFHPHHLLFAPIVRGVYLVLSTVSGAVDAILAAQTHNAVWAGIAVACVFAVLRRQGLSRGGAAAGGLALLACQGFLLFATQAEVYLPAAACSAGLFLLLARVQHEPSTPWWPAALLLALMIFYHQTTVLFCLPLLLFFGLRGRLATGARVVGVAGTVTLSAYVAAYVAVTEDVSVPGFVRWTLGYAVGDHETWGVAENVGSSGLLTLLDRQRWNIVHLPDALAPAAAVIVGLALAALVARALVALRRGERDGELPAMLASWLLVHGAFFLWWQPEQKEFFAISLLPIVLLAMTAAGASPRGRRVTVLAALLFAVVALPVHVALTLRPLQTGTRDEVPQARDLLQAAPPGCGFYASRLVGYALRYDFGVTSDRVRNVRLVRRRALLETPDPLSSPLTTDCVALPFSQIDPRSPRGDAVTDPEDWWAFVTRTLRLVSSADGALTFPGVTFVAGESGVLYLVQDGMPVTVDGRAAFCRWMDERLQADTGRTQTPFSRWMSRQGAASALPAISP